MELHQVSPCPLTDILCYIILQSNGKGEHQSNFYTFINKYINIRIEEIVLVLCFSFCKELCNHAKFYNYHSVIITIIASTSIQVTVPCLVRGLTIYL